MVGWVKMEGKIEKELQWMVQEEQKKMMEVMVEEQQKKELDQEGVVMVGDWKRMEMVDQWKRIEKDKEEQRLGQLRQEVTERVAYDRHWEDEQQLCLQDQQSVI